MIDDELIFDFCKAEFKFKEGKTSEQRITLFALSTCMWCKKCKKWLDERGVEYRYIDVDQINSETKAEIIKCLRMNYNGRISYPFLIVDGEAVVGYDPSKYEKLIKTGGN
jgi:glutaredoxin-like protein NrdH